MSCYTRAADSFCTGKRVPVIVGINYNAITICKILLQKTIYCSTIIMEKIRNIYTKLRVIYEKGDSLLSCVE